jgi:hypothetical protein
MDNGSVKESLIAPDKQGGMHLSPAKPLISEIDSQCNLTCAIPCVLGCLRSAEHSERRQVVDLRRGGREVRVVQNIRKCGFEPQLCSLSERKDFRSTERYRFCSGTLENSHVCVAESAGSYRSWGKCAMLKARFRDCPR